jgi:glycosyltransferase involved in cell wall biosynthesis
VLQRPQHLLTRLARRWRVVYVEEPVAGAAAQTLETFEPVSGVEVWRPHVTGDAPGFHDEHLPALRQMIGDSMRERDVADYWLWFDTPMALPVTTGFDARGIVYDCMDELSALPGAPKQLVQRENALFKSADLVFTGGPSLHNAKKHRHPDVHCFPCSVDASHFAPTQGEHPLHADIPRPRLGYCGVIDERINLALVDAIAKARPEWNVVMAGPVVRMDAGALPRRDNIHWLGAQSHVDLPRFISGWDVALLPYALNDATRFISPTAPLEAMACGTPAVSTSIRDIVEPYGHLLRIADTPEGFIADIEVLMARPEEEREVHRRQLAQAVAKTSWDRTADAIAELIAQADDIADSGGLFVKSQPRVDERPAIPLYLANAAQAVKQVATGDRVAANRAAAH